MAALDLPGTVTEYGLGGNHKAGTAWKGLAQFDEVELRENKCGDCRACWTRKVTNVSYGQH